LLDERVEESRVRGDFIQQRRLFSRVKIR